MVGVAIVIETESASRLSVDSTESPRRTAATACAKAWCVTHILSRFHCLPLTFNCLAYFLFTAFPTQSTHILSRFH